MGCRRDAVVTAMIFRVNPTSVDNTDKKNAHFRTSCFLWLDRHQRTPLQPPLPTSLHCLTALLIPPPPPLPRLLFVCDVPVAEGDVRPQAARGASPLGRRSKYGFAATPWVCWKTAPR